MADLEITADVRSVVQAEKTLNQMQNQLTRLFKKYDRGAVSQDAFKKGLLELKRGYAALGVSSQKASGQVQKYTRDLERAKAAQDKAAQQQEWFAAQRRRIQLMEQSARMEARAAQEAERNAQRQARAAESIKEQYLPLYAASKRYERALDEINKAHREGVLSTAQYDTALENLNTQYSQLNTRGVGNIRGMNNLGMAMQQTGYQVGDFLVQVQSGTNAMVAFGQQATQLVGILPMFSDSLGISAGRLIAWSAGLGIAIPLVTALGAAYMRTREGGKTFEDNLQELESAVSKYKSSMQEASTSTTELNVRFGDVSDSIRPFLQDLQELNRITALNRLQEQFEELETNSASFFQMLGASVVGGAALQAELAKEVGMTADEYSELRKRVEELKQAETVSDRVAAATSIRNLIKETVGDTANMTQEMRNFYESLVQAVISGGELEGVMEGSNSATSVAADHADRLASRMQAAAEAAFQYQLYTATAYGQTRGTGVTLADVESGNLTPPPLPDSSSGGGGAQQEDRIGALARSLATQTEMTEIWRQESLEKLQEFNQKELELLGGHTEAKARIEEEYQDKISQIQKQKQDAQRSQMSQFFNDAAGLMQSESKALFNIGKAAAIAEAVIASERSIVNAYAFGSRIGGPALGSAFAATAAAATAIRIKNIASTQIGGGSSSGGGGGGGSIATPSSAAPAPQRVLIEGITPDSMISGSMLQNIFDKLYEENEDRGLVFQISS